MNPIIPVVALLIGLNGAALAQSVAPSFPASQNPATLTDSGLVKVFTLDQAIQTAVQRNSGIQAGQYEVELEQSLRKTASDLGRTSFSLTRGQFNSVYTDNNITITQNIPFPTTMTRQAALARANIRSRELQLAITRNDLIYQVKAAYYQLAFFRARQQLLTRQDSLYANFARASGIRYKTGESNLLEKATAESALYEVRTLLAQNEADVRIYQTQLQTLLNTPEPVSIADTTLTKRPYRLDTAQPPDNLSAVNSRVALARQQVEVSQRTRDLERSRLLPEFSLGYFNQSLIGFQNTSGVASAPEQFFNASKRFTGFTAGISIPLWFRPQVARIQAAALGQQVAQANAELLQKNLTGQYNEAVQQYLKYRQSVAYYEQNALPQAELILQNAQKSFRGGDIGYVEYLQGLNRALTIQTTYLDILNQHNQAIIRLEFLSGNQ